MPKDRLHVTVAFLGGLTEAGLEVARSVPPIAVGPFDLALDRLGEFANGGVALARPEHDFGGVGRARAQAVE